MTPTFSTCRRAATFVVALALCLTGSGASVAQDEAGFQAFVQILAREAASRGISRATIDAVVPTLRLNPRVIALDRAQPGSDPTAPIPDFAPYKARHVDAQRIAGGRAAYQAQRARLAQIERETGVPE